LIQASYLSHPHDPFNPTLPRLSAVHRRSTTFTDGIQLGLTTSTSSFASNRSQTTHLRSTASNFFAPALLRRLTLPPNQLFVGNQHFTGPHHSTGITQQSRYVRLDSILLSVSKTTREVKKTIFRFDEVCQV